MKTNLKIKDYIIIILGVLLVGLLVALGIFINKYKDAESSVVKWTDEAYTYKNKYNEEYNAKKTYILKAEELEQYNKDLYAEYKSLKENPLVITKTDVQVRIDTIKTNIYDGIFTNDKITWKWNANDSTYYTINGESGVILLDSINKKVYTNVNQTIIDANLTMDVIDDGTQLSVIAKTNNPYITLSNMQSVAIDPTTSPTISKYFKPKRWGFGPTLSAGLLFGLGFNGDAIVGAGGCIGLSLHYDLIQW